MLPLTRFGLVSAPWSQAQVPWSRSLLSQATWVFRLPSDFRSSRCFPPTAFTSRFRSPLPGLRHCFRSQVPVSSGLVLRFARHPCLVTAESEPPGFKPRPLVFFNISSRCAGFGAGDFPQFPLLSIVRFRPHGSEPVSRHTTLLSIAVRRCRPTACFGLHATPVS